MKASILGDSFPGVSSRETPDVDGNSRDAHEGDAGQRGTESVLGTLLRNNNQEWRELLCEYGYRGGYGLPREWPHTEPSEGSTLVR